MSTANKIVNALLEADFDPKAFVSRAEFLTHPVIRTSFSRVKWLDDEEHEEEHGWKDKEGETFELDEFDVEDGVDIPKKAAKWLKDRGVTEASSSNFHPGVWYTSEPQQNYRTGDGTTFSFHLDGFSPEDERQIYNLVFPPRRPSPPVFPNQPQA